MNGIDKLLTTEAKKTSTKTSSVSKEPETKKVMSGKALMDIASKINKYHKLQSRLRSLGSRNVFDATIQNALTAYTGSADYYPEFCDDEAKKLLNETALDLSRLYADKMAVEIQNVVVREIDKLKKELEALGIYDVEATKPNRNLEEVDNVPTGTIADAVAANNKANLVMKYDGITLTQEPILNTQA